MSAESESAEDEEKPDCADVETVADAAVRHMKFSLYPGCLHVSGLTYTDTV